MLRLKLDHALAHFERGRTWHAKHNAQKVLADLEAAARLGPALRQAHNLLAWLMATATDNKCRDGQLALTAARDACDLSWWKNGSYIDTLAAAYAESGDFAAAVRWQIKAIELLGDKEHPDYDAMQTRLELYRGGRPYREPHE